MRFNDRSCSPGMGLLRFRLVKSDLHCTAKYCMEAASSIALFAICNRSPLQQDRQRPLDAGDSHPESQRGTKQRDQAKPRQKLQRINFQALAGGLRGREGADMNKRHLNQQMKKLLTVISIGGFLAISSIALAQQAPDIAQQTPDIAQQAAPTARTGLKPASNR